MQAKLRDDARLSDPLADPLQLQSEEAAPPSGEGRGLIQRLEASGFGGGVESPSIPSGGGSALPDGARSKMEGAFGTSFSDVRVHSGSSAAPQMGAVAFTQGSDIHFAPGAYDPSSASGQSLLGHELTHVVQQRQGRVSTPQGKGLPINSDASLEREADVLGARAARGEPVNASVSSASADSGFAPVQRKAAGGPIQMAAVDSHFGTFTDEKYAINGNKVDFVVKFTPNDKTDATKIGMSQSIRATSGGVNVAIDPAARERMTGSGHRIDRLSDKNNPIYGASSLGGGQGLSSTAQDNNTSGGDTELNPDNGDNATYQLGHHYKDGDVWKTKDAGLYDAPTTNAGANSSKEFESTALAIEGTQTGTYYGSVKWGWKKDGSGTLSLIPFGLVSQGVPSKDFLGAAEKWNSVKVRGTVVPIADGTNVYDNTYTSKYTVDKTQDMEQSATYSRGGVNYIQVTLKGGAHDGDVGRVKVSEVKDKGDGSDTVDLPVPEVNKVTDATALYSDSLQSKRVQTLAKGTRVKVTSTKGMVSEIEVVDGPDTGTKGWILKSKLAKE